MPHCTYITKIKKQFMKIYLYILLWINHFPVLLFVSTCMSLMNKYMYIRILSTLIWFGQYTINLLIFKHNNQIPNNISSSSITNLHYNQIFMPSYKLYIGRSRKRKVCTIFPSTRIYFCFHWKLYQAL